MLDFVNWFFTFFGSFVSMLSRLVVSEGVSIGLLFVSVMVFLMVGRFLVGYWKNKSIGSDDDAS